MPFQPASEWYIVFIRFESGLVFVPRVFVQSFDDMSAACG